MRVMNTLTQNIIDNLTQLLEEGYLDCKDQTMTTAMTWALQRAYSWMTTGKLSDR